MAECLCLTLQKASNGLDSVATLEFDSERMLGQRDASLFLICLQSRLKKGLKVSRFGLVSHVTAREEMKRRVSQLQGTDGEGVGRGYGEGQLRRLIDVFLSYCSKLIRVGMTSEWCTSDHVTATVRQANSLICGSVAAKLESTRSCLG